MHDPQLLDKIKNEIRPYLENQGLDLVDLQCFYQQGRLALRIFVDYPQGGINLETCVYLNREISNMLDTRQTIDESYVLEVSSPGVDRPLKTQADFRRAINRKALFFLVEVIEGKREISGIIKDVDGNFVYVGYNDNQISVPLEKIINAKQVV